jgi:hypothetical protein
MMAVIKKKKLSEGEKLNLKANKGRKKKKTGTTRAPEGQDHLEYLGVDGRIILK